MLKPSVTCYPVHHSEALDLLRPAQSRGNGRPHSQSFFLHLWNEVLRRFHVSKTMLPPRGSLLRAIAERHPVDGWSGEYDVDVLEHALSVETELRQIRKEIDALRRQQRQRKDRKRQKSDRTTVAATENRRWRFADRLRAVENALTSLVRYLRPQS